MWLAETVLHLDRQQYIERAERLKLKLHLSLLGQLSAFE